MLPILDYDDMTKVGSAAPHPDNIKIGQRKYAVIIKNAHAHTGKFDISDKSSVEESVFALTNNKSIPDVIRKSAEYFVKQAADYFGVNYDIAASPAPHEIILSDIIVKTAEHDDVPMLSFGSVKFVLSDEEQIKRAEEYFVMKQHLFPAVQRINVSRIIVKAAAFTPHIPGEVVKAYSRAEYGNHVEDVLEKKACLASDPKYASVMRSLARCYHSIPVAEFIDMVETCDRAAEVNHKKAGIETHEILSDVHRSVVDQFIGKAAEEEDETLRISRNV
ncbi:MAG: hypothetical protein Q8M92_03595 [Candidatus Subteraquimicrobiales bacterium]|nr:hypothetical protein [Candidatus Subteraquimicrobiales bacterium]